MSGTDEVYSVNKDMDTNEITQKISCEEITEQDPNAKENCKNSVSNINKNMAAQQESHTNSNLFANPEMTASMQSLYERIISNLESEILFLREELKTREMHFIEEIRFLNKTCNNSVNISGSTAHDDANFFSHQQNINFQDKNRKNRVGVSPKWDINNEQLKSDNRNNSDGKINARRDIHKKNTKQIKNNHVNNSSNISPTKERSDVTTREGGNGNGNNHSKGNRKKVIILSASMCKDLNGWDLSQKIKQNASVSLKSISGARTSCMEDYSMPSLRENPDHFILHVGTNNLPLKESAETISNDIINLALKLKNEHHDVTVSSIIIRQDRYKDKVMQVNNILKDRCMENNLYYHDHSDTIKESHLKRKSLHLNSRGSTVLGKNLVKHLSEIFN